MRELLAACRPQLVSPAEAGGPGDGTFHDADTPAAARALGLVLP
jgi:hypothetical protein